MFKQTLAAIVTAFAAVACSAADRDYNKLDVKERAAFEKCRITAIREGRTALRGVEPADIPKKTQELQKNAGMGCAKEMKIDPKTVPGLLPQ